ncbi:Integrase catalytic region [Intrasporangium calvum DSM 43043]|uniref:Integrase catalytic region n=1 Tax=Intrasporangium calvum (strain ATCC 23552 / DSM 43043 / JCM 3097 / NBRC 12989 / NCIMB 10167 / NRRL B-3866 / 7 KIP) TaxID=710696 RepID=E6SC46_INTC7|nr:Integrase catalytic region [Intrasporangium calvum DSM 43043]
MGFREVSVSEVREVLRGWLDGAGLRTVAERAGVDRKTARRYVQAAQEAGLDPAAGWDALDDGLVGQVVVAVRPVRPNGHGRAWEALLAHEEQIRAWVAGDGKDAKPLSIVKIEELLARQGTVVPYRTLHRFATERCGYRAKESTVRVNDGEPGAELQVDFGQMGYLTDQDGRRRKVHALIFTAVYSRHMFVWLTHAQTLAAVIAGCEAAWAFFGGVFKVIVPDNLKPVVTDADAVNPRLSQGWLDYAQHAGFVTDPARVRRPKDKPRVERTVQYVRGNFWAGESFTDLADAQVAASRWCAQRAGMRIHGTIQARPIEVFLQAEAPVLLPAPDAYDVPIFARVKVHRDFHVEVAKSLYSLPEQYLGQHLDVRADSELVKLYQRGALVKTHPRQRPGGRSTDPADLPEHQASYALRDLARLIGTCAGHGANIGIYAERILDDPLPWTRMRAVYRLLGLVRRYGPDPVEQACDRALQLDVISVTKIASMLERATEHTTPTLPTATAATTTRFARQPTEFMSRTTRTANSWTTPASRGTALAIHGTTVATEPVNAATNGTTALSLIPGSAREAIAREDAPTPRNPQKESTR